MTAGAGVSPIRVTAAGRIDRSGGTSADEVGDVRDPVEQCSGRELDGLRRMQDHHGDGEDVRVGSPGRPTQPREVGG